MAAPTEYVSPNALPEVLTLGRGKVLVRKDTETAWLDLCHVKEFKVSIAADELEHENLRRSLKIVDKTVITKLKATGSFVIDAPILDNLAMFFMADTITKNEQTSGSWAAQSFTVDSPGKWQDLGKKFLTITKIEDDSTPTPVVLVEGTDYEIDLIRGAIRPIPTSSYIGSADDVFKVTGDYAEQAYYSIGVGETSKIVRHIWFCGDPATGKREDVLGYATLKPNGDLSMIGDEWQTFTIEFTFSKHANYSGIYEYRDYGKVS